MMNRMAVGLLVLAGLVFAAMPVSAQTVDFRGIWNVKADQEQSTWIIGEDNNTLFGASKWNCCPGFRVDRLSGQVDGNQVLIIRFIVKQGMTAPISGTQEYRGVYSNGKITGTWEGLGGSGKWVATISK